MNIQTKNFQIQDISFCNKTADNVVDKNLKGIIIKAIRDNYDINLQDKNFVNLSPKIIKNVSNNQHLLSLRSTGNPYHLLLIKVNNQNRCFFIDQKLKTGFTLPRMIHVNYQFAKELFDGTIFDGDLVRDKCHRWVFIISDILVYRNRKLIQSTDKKLDMTIIERVKLIDKILSQQYQPDQIFDICPLLVRKFFLYSQYDEMINQFMTSLPYQIKAVCFHTLNNQFSNYVYNLSEDERENKEKENGYKTDLAKISCNNNDNNNDNTRDTSMRIGKPLKTDNKINDKIEKFNKNGNVIFQIVKTSFPDVYDLYFINDENQLEKYNDHPLIKTMEISLRLRSLFETVDKTENVYIKCVYAPHAKKWKWRPLEKVEGIKKPDNNKKIQKVITTSLQLLSEEKTF
jgi:hypothetical protein